jgi:hypothetical protein
MQQSANRQPAPGRRRVLIGAFLLALVCWVTGATPAQAAGTGHYNAATVKHNPTFTTLLTGNLLPPGVLENSGTVLYLSTTGTGLHKLPFALQLYNQSYTNIAIGSNGNIQPGVTSPGGAPNPNGPFSCNFPVPLTGNRPAVLVFWAPLYYDTASTFLGYPQGVFVRTTGASPHRTFTVSWQARDLDQNGGAVLAQAVFTEGSPTVNYIYGSTVSSRDFLTIGIQSKAVNSVVSWTSYTACDSPNSAPGTQLTWTHTG